MKKLLLSLIALTTFTLSAKAQTVNIPDANFKAALVGDTLINTNKDAEIQVSEAVAYLGDYSGFGKSLDVSGENISDLTGIEAFTNIEGLDCSNNQLTSLDLSANTGGLFGGQVICSNNPLTSLKLPNVGGLFCDSTLLRSLDLSKIGYHTVYINNNPLLTSLKTGSGYGVHCENNPQLTHVSVFGNHSEVFLSNNNLSSLIMINVDIDILNCSNNQLTSLDLSSNTRLYKINCSNNQLTFVNLRNGNNNNLNTDLTDNYPFASSFKNNPKLTCISVDDPIYSSTNWGAVIDAQTQFSTFCCGSLTLNVDSVLDASCLNTGYAQVSGSKGIGSYTYNWATTPIVTDSFATFTNAGVYPVTVTDDSLCTRTTAVVISGKHSGNGFDMATNVFARSFRPGRTTVLNLSALNKKCSPASGQLTLVPNGLITYDSAGVVPHAINGDTLVWNFTDWISDSATFNTPIYFTVDTNANIGDRICFDVAITPLAADNDTANNNRQYCFDVSNSYDPNDKQVSPQGVCAENFTLKNQALTYTVRFQNTGNANAIDVYLLDTLSTHLDSNSLRVIEASHPLITQVLPDNAIRFDFKNINLPDSNSNEAASHGFVTYEIMPKSGLPNGTVINNSAAIYFDFNAPVITNSTKNTLTDVLPITVTTTLNETSGYMLNGKTYTNEGTYKQYFYSADGCDSIVTLNISQPLGVQSLAAQNISIYPNPFKENITINTTEISSNINVKIIDVQGRRMAITVQYNTNNILINTSQLTAGFYVIELSNSTGIIGRSKMVKE